MGTATASPSHRGWAHRMPALVGWQPPTPDQDEPHGQAGAFPSLLRGLALVGLAAMVLLPVLESALRAVAGRTVVASGAWVQHLTLWVGLVGGILASIQDRHFSIEIGEALRKGTVPTALSAVARGGAAGILMVLALAAWETARSMAGLFGAFGEWLPDSVAIAPLPAAFLIMAVVTLARPGESWGQRLGMVAVAAAVPLVGSTLLGADGVWPVAAGLVALVGLAAAGMPLYACLGGVAVLLFIWSGGSAASVPLAAYEIARKHSLPSIPLFALAGVVLARGGAPSRLLRLVRAWVGWMPGGASVATIMGCAFFTAITGASGVTILALGGLFLPILLAARHQERFSLGLITASGSVGLLFPPSLPVILCAVYGRIGLDRLFVASFLPGILLLLALAGFALYRGRNSGAARQSFNLREALAATGGAWGDLGLPLLVVAAFYGGLMAPVETASLAALWAMILEVGIHRSLDVRRGLSGAFFETAVIVGALVVVIGMAQGLFNVLWDLQVPNRAASWIPSIIHSRWAFLLVLNLVLLLVGAFLDIYSAIVVVVPLLLPLAGVYGIEPAHLGVVFLANMELGYLTPPVGMNLFLSSLTFQRRLLEVWRAALPFFLILVAWVLLVTYLPFLTTGVAERLLGG